MMRGEWNRKRRFFVMKASKYLHIIPTFLFTCYMINDAKLPSYLPHRTSLKSTRNGTCFSSYWAILSFINFSLFGEGLLRGEKTLFEVKS